MIDALAQRVRERRRSSPLRAALAELTAAAALYGFCAGCAHSLDFGLRNLVKAPLLMLVTSAVCAIAYHVVAGFFGARLSFRAVQRLSLSLFRDASLLLASFAPAALFLSLTIRLPDAHGLNAYPLFLVANVAVIALCGSIALVRQARRVVATTQLSRARGRALVGAWLALSLFVGSQAAWFLRPFFGVATIPAAQTPFFLGSAPDFRGATSFYEALSHVAAPPRSHP